MMTGELIWGPSFLEELSKPHPDPQLRAMEEQMNELQMNILRAYFQSPEYNNNRWLPAHYGDKK